MDTKRCNIIQKETMDSVLLGVMHDMRSPLTTVKILLKQAILPEAQKKAAEHALDRLYGMTDEVLAMYCKKRKHFNGTQATTQPESIIQLLEDIIREKQIQYNQSAIQFKLRVQELASNAWVNLNAGKFERCMSNLINNAVEAMAENGTVYISVGVDNEEKLLISIQDEGKGISRKNLKKILTKGGSFGKAQGSGIGLPSAMQLIQSSGGCLWIESVEGKGTTVFLNLPVWHRKTVETTETQPDFIYIDDDNQLTEAWEVMARKQGKKLVVIHSVEEVNRHIGRFHKDVPIYIDSNLGGEIKGEVLAKQLFDKGFTQLYLATGYDEFYFSPMPWIKKIVSKDYPYSENP